MSLKNQIEEKLNQALKDKDKNTYPTLRLVVSAIKDAEIANRTKDNKEISDSQITMILKKMIKQRNESCDVYKKAGRTELLNSETKEIEVIGTFLPKQLNEDQTKKICEECKGNGFIRVPYKQAYEEMWANCETCDNEGEIVVEKHHLI